MIIFLQKKLNTLHPAWSGDLDNLHKLKNNEVYKCKVTRPRNLKHHRKFFAMLTIVFNNLPESLEGKFKTTEDLLFELKLQAGHHEKYITMGGKEVIRAKSISFEKMDQTEFEAFYDKALDMVCKFILPGIEKEDLLTEITAF